MGIFGAIGNIASTAMQYAMNKELQQRQFDWQERMSNTAHQREVTDLRNAGLNPILSATGGNGANTPSGGNTSVDNPNLTEGWLQAKSTASQVEVNESQANLNKEQAETEESKREYNEALSGLTNMEKLIKSEEFKYLPEKLKTEILMNRAKATESFANASARQIEANSSKITAEANKTNAETNRTSSPIRWAHDAGKRHLESFKKDHPILSTTPLYKHFRNYFE